MAIMRLKSHTLQESSSSKYIMTVRASDSAVHDPPRPELLLLLDTGAAITLMAACLSLIFFLTLFPQCKSRIRLAGANKYQEIRYCTSLTALNDHVIWAEKATPEVAPEVVLPSSNVGPHPNDDLQCMSDADGARQTGQGPMWLVTKTGMSAI